MQIILGQTYENVLREYSHMITKICILNLRNSDDAKDCFQNTFIKLYQTNTEFHDKNHLKAWLIRVAINECKNYRKKYYRLTVDIDQVIVPEHKNDLKLINEVLLLPHKYRNILYLYYYEGYHVQEISAMLQMNENTVKSYLKRGRDLLREKVGDFYE